MTSTPLVGSPPHAARAASPPNGILVDRLPIPSGNTVVEFLGQSDQPYRLEPSGNGTITPMVKTQGGDREHQAGLYGGGIGLGLVATAAGAVGLTSGLVDQHAILLGVGISLMVVGVILLIAFAILVRNLGRQLGA